MVEWPAEEGALYTLVLSNLDINTRENRFAFEISHIDLDINTRENKC